MGLVTKPSRRKSRCNSRWSKSMGPDKWLDMSAWFIRGWITSWTVCTLEGIVRAQEQTNKQCQKQIIIMIMITTRHRVRSMHGGDNTSSLEQRSEYKAWTRSLITKSGLKVWVWGPDWVTDLAPGDCKKINSRAVSHSI